MSLLNSLRSRKSKTSTAIRNERVSEVHKLLKKAKEQGGDPFFEYRKKYREKKLLPEKYEFGMNCFLDTIEPEIRQAVYEELIKSNDIGTVNEFIDSFGDAQVPTLFGIRNIRCGLDTYNKVATDKKTFIKVGKKDFIRTMLERPDLERTFLEKGGVRDGRKFIHATKQKVSDILLGTEPWLAKGVEFYQKGKYTEALECYDRAIEIEPLDARAWHNKAATLGKLGKYKEAVKCEDKVLKIAPKFVEAWHNKANFFSSLKDYEEEVKCYDRMLEVNPKLDWVWNNKGACLEILGRYKEAIECVNKLIELDPSNPRWSKKGGLLFKLKKHKEAVECCDKALAKYPKDAQAWYFKGLAFTGLKEAKAVQYFKLAIKLDPKIANMWKGMKIQDKDIDIGEEYAYKLLTEKPKFLQRLEDETEHEYSWRLAVISVGLTDKSRELDKQDRLLEGSKLRLYSEVIGKIISSTISSEKELSDEETDKLMLAGDLIVLEMKLHEYKETEIEDFLSLQGSLFWNMLLLSMLFPQIYSWETARAVANSFVKERAERFEKENREEIEEWKKQIRNLNTFEEYAIKMFNTIWEEIKGEMVEQLEKEFPEEKGLCTLRLLLPRVLVTIFFKVMGYEEEVRKRGYEGNLRQMLLIADKSMAKFLFSKLAEKALKKEF